MSFKKIAVIGQHKNTSRITGKFKSAKNVTEVLEGSFEEIFKLDLQSINLVIDTDESEDSILIERLHALERKIGKDALIAAYSPTMSTTKIISTLENPGRFIGLHFFRLNPNSNLVEIVRPEKIIDVEPVKRVSQFLEEAGFKAVQVKDRPGLLANRLLIPYINQAVQAFDDGIATAEDIDNAVCLGLGYPVGPLKLLDQIGIGDYVTLATKIYQEMGEKKYIVPAKLKRMVEAGMLGEESGKGFYEYN